MLCDRIFLIDRGRIVAQGSPQALKDQLPFDRVLEVECAGTLEEVSLKDLPEQDKIILSGADGSRILRVHSRDPRRLLPEILHRLPPGATVKKAAITEPSLEDVFIHLTGRTLDRG